MPVPMDCRSGSPECHEDQAFVLHRGGRVPRPTRGMGAGTKVGLRASALEHVADALTYRYGQNPNGLEPYAPPATCVHRTCGLPDQSRFPARLRCPFSTCARASRLPFPTNVLTGNTTTSPKDVHNILAAKEPHGVSVCLRSPFVFASSTMKS